MIEKNQLTNATVGLFSLLVTGLLISKNDEFEKNDLFVGLTIFLLEFSSMILLRI